MSVFLVKLKPGGFDFGSDHNVARFNEWSRENEGKTIRIEIPQPKRSSQQNRYYWMYLEIVARETGNNPEDLHDFLRTRLLPRKHVVVTGKNGSVEVEVHKSTTDLTKIEFGEYLEKICAMTEIPLPDREQAGYILN